MKKTKNLSLWSWIPTLYLAEGLPYVAVVTIAGIMYKKLGISNFDITLYTGWLYLPWVIKPFWSPFVDLYKTKRQWIIAMQLLIGVGFAGIAFTIPATFFFQATLAFFWLLSFCSATHDIAADGFYLLALDSKNQAKFVGIRSTFYRLATILGQGILIIIAGTIEKTTDNPRLAWSVTFIVLAIIFLLFSFYHKIFLPKPDSDSPAVNISAKILLKNFANTFVSFFTKPGIVRALFFLLTFRFSESQTLAILKLFLIDGRDKGGLGMTTSEVGFTYGTIGIIALTIGGIVGGYAASKGGLKKWIWFMTLSLLLPTVVYVYLAYSQTCNMLIINISIFVEQFGYGFGFTAYLLYMMHFSDGKQKTSHYAICTGFMALGMMLPGMFSGWLQELIGYTNFFIWAVLCGILPACAVLLLRLPEK
ncbi:MAG: MFS transporter [Marinilabiliaceae bacterium]|nr:MFS transporter [Marinilabiliaceae bacterium]